MKIPADTRAVSSSSKENTADLKISEDYTAREDSSISADCDFQRRSNCSKQQSVAGCKKSCGRSTSPTANSTNGSACVRVKRKMSHHHMSRGSKNLNVVSQKKPGMVTLPADRITQLIRKEPVEKYYTIEEEPIGSGNFSEVYRCRRKDTGAYYAGKFVTLRRLGANEGQVTSGALHEIAILDACRPCPRMIRLYEIYQEKDRVVLILEYAAGGDFQSVLDEDQVPLESDVARFMRQILDGLCYIHDRQIVHMDIKPQNLVLTGPFPCCDVKLCDFESSRVLKDGHVNEILGTADYVAPEILHFEPITTSADMWSVGVLTYVLLTGCSPFGGETDQETLLNITQAQLDFPEELFAHISKDAQDFIKSLLKKSPSQRPTARECLHHPWLTRRSYRRRKNLYKLAAKPPSMPALPFYKPPSKPPSLPSLLRSSQWFMPNMTASTPSLVTPVMTISTPCLLMSPLGPLSPVNSFRVDMDQFTGGVRLDDPTVAFQQTLAAIARSNSASRAIPAAMQGRVVPKSRHVSPSATTTTIVLPTTISSPTASQQQHLTVPVVAMTPVAMEQKNVKLTPPAMTVLEINPGTGNAASEDVALPQSVALPLSSQPKPESSASRRSSSSSMESHDNYVSQDSSIEEDRSDLDPETDEQFKCRLLMEQPQTNVVDAKPHDSTEVQIPQQPLANDIAALNLASFPQPRKLVFESSFVKHIEQQTQAQQPNKQTRKISPAQEELSVRSASFEKLLSGFMQRLGHEQSGQSHNRARIVDFCKSPSPSSVSIPPPFAEFTQQDQIQGKIAQQSQAALMKISPTNEQASTSNGTSIRSRVHSWEGLVAGSGNPPVNNKDCGCLFTATPAVIEEHSESCPFDTDAGSVDSESSSTCSSTSTVTERPPFGVTSVTPTPDDIPVFDDEPDSSTKTEGEEKSVETVEVEGPQDAPAENSQEPEVRRVVVTRTISAFGSVGPRYVVPCSPRPARRSSVPGSLRQHHQDTASRKSYLYAQSMPSFEVEDRGAVKASQPSSSPVSPTTTGACSALQIPPAGEGAASQLAADQKSSKVEVIAERLKQRRCSVPAGTRYWGRICSGSYAKALQSFRKRCGKFESVSEASEDADQLSKDQPPIGAESGAVEAGPASEVDPGLPPRAASTGMATSMTDVGQSHESVLNKDSDSKRETRSTEILTTDSLLDRSRHSAAARPVRQLR